MLIKFNYTPAQIENIKNQIIEKFEGYIYQLNNFSLNKFKNDQNIKYFINNFSNSLSDFDYIYEPIIFLQSVSPNSKIQKASIKFQMDLAKYFMKFYTNSEYYNLFKNIKVKDDPLLQKILTHIVKSFFYSGASLTPKKKRIFKKYETKLLNYENKFMQNIYSYNKKLILDKTEVQGLSPTFLKSVYDSKTDRYIIGTSYPEQDEVMKYCRNGATREHYYKLINNIAYPKNMTILQKMLEVRYKIANILGYKDNIKLKLSYNRIATSEAKINNIIDMILPKLIKNGKKEFDTIIEFRNNIIKNIIKNKINKNNKTNSINIPFKPSDITYYSNLYKESKYKINSAQFKKHFPLKHVISQIFKLFERIFKIKIKKINNNKTWHKDVETYYVYEGSIKLGILFLDLFPREYKYNHAATFDLQDAYIHTTGERIVPATAVVCNFDRHFMTHGEITTFCHEMGHALHNIFSRVKYSELSGTKTEIDFVETVSQFFENWAWTPKFLRYISKPVLPSNIINKIVGTRYYNISLHYLRQILFIKYDLTVHKNAKNSLTELHDIWFNISRQIMPFMYNNSSLKVKDINEIKEINFLINPMCSFGHLVGYDVAYYSYLWSVIYSYDILSEFNKHPGKLFSPVTGQKLKKIIMEQGGSKSGVELLSEFLGRLPNEKYFLKSIF